jgi:hypothetical protein
MADEVLREMTGQPPKVVLRAMERAQRHGLIECGVSLRSGWLTAKGEDVAHVDAASLHAGFLRYWADLPPERKMTLEAAFGAVVESVVTRTMLSINRLCHRPDGCRHMAAGYSGWCTACDLDDALNTCIGVRE